MTSDLAAVLGLALLAMLNPSLVAATTVMLLLPNPKRLMLGYLLGAYTTAIGVGLAIVFSLQGSSFSSTAKRTASPAQDMVVGTVLLLVALVLATERDAPVRERRQRRKRAKVRAGQAKEPWSQRMLGRGSVGIAFALGALLSFPGVSYLTALARIAKIDPGTAPTVLLVVGFCVIELVPLEAPLLGYTVAPQWTQHAVTSFRTWLRLSGRRVVVIATAALGVILIARGVLAAV